MTPWPWKRAEPCGASCGNPLLVPWFAPFDSATSAYCSPEQDPFLLLESSLRCIEHILRCHVNQPLRRSWIEHPYGEEEISAIRVGNQGGSPGE